MVKLIALSIALAVDVLAAYGLIYNGRLVRLMRKTRTLPIKDVRRGYAEVKGRVVGTGEALRGPLSGKPCVYYHLRVEERGEAQSIMIEDKRSAPWLLSDDSGLARVDLSSARLLIHPVYKAGPISPVDSHQDEVLALYGKSPRFLFFDIPLWFSEIIVQEGDELYVLGPVRFERSGVNRPGSSSSTLPSVYFSDRGGPPEAWSFSALFKAPFIVSDESERRTLKKHQWQVVGFAIVFFVVSIGTATIYVFL